MGMNMESIELEIQPKNLAGKVAVVTGGYGALCSVFSFALAQANAKVAILGRHVEEGEKVVESIKAQGGEGLALACDVIDKNSLEISLEKIHAAFGPIDILINGAGGNHPGATTSIDLPFFALEEAAIEHVFDLNFKGTFLACQVFGQDMAEKGEGIIINIASMNAFRPLTRIPAYSAAKSAVANFTQWLAVHMAQEYSPRIRVNAIAPGFFLTQQNRFLLIDEETGDLTPRGQSIIDHTPQGRFGEPCDLITTLMWLLTEGAEHVTGTIIPVDGGFSAFSGV
jgi:NAD(P)-dependent dehydrogenase (short-subunit alcohol dehydrogenase family)